MSAVPVPQDAAPSLRRRFASMAYEAILLFAVAFIGVWLFQFAAGTLAIEGWRRHLLQFFLLAVFAIYFVWCWTRGGQTLAMKTWRICVVSKEGHRRLTPRQALLRYLCAWLLPVSVLWALVDRDRQFLHDRIAGSLLIPAE
ncbi:MAG: RDD family protein [Burkholderiales bacterium]